MIQSNRIEPVASDGERQQEGLTPAEGPDTLGIDLTPAQALAIELIIAGRTPAAVAAAVGVDRGTIYRWRTENPAFVAALKRWRALMQDAARDRLMALTEGANDAIAKSIADGDGRLAHKVLAAMGCAQPGPLEEPEPPRYHMKNVFGPIVASMTDDQILRIPELLELGVKLDNEKRAADKAAEAQWADSQAAAEGSEATKNAGD